LVISLRQLLATAHWQYHKSDILFTLMLFTHTVSTIMVTILEVLGKEIINDKQVKTWIEGGIQDMFEWICI
jgi:hypothetical protein